MIDVNYLSENIEVVIKRLATRNIDVSSLKEIVNLNDKRKKIIIELETKQSKHKQSSKTVSDLVKENKNEEISNLKSVLLKNKEEISLLENKLLNINLSINNLLLEIPNIPDASVPIGNDEIDNVEIRKWSQPKALLNVKSHWEIAKELDIIDFERATKISGSRFIIYKKQGAMLVRALINFMLDYHITNGYQEILPPVIVNERALITTGNLPKFKEELFQLQEKKYYLIPTAEVPLTNLHQDEIVEGKNLPINYCAYTSCFRSEAGAAGKDTRGIIRLHQFHKVELVKFVKPEKSYEELEILVTDAEKILQLLELPYRVILLCTGDLGFSASKTYDIEVWMPAQDKYREISSCSNFEDYQARRGKIRYKDSVKDKTNFVHTLNGSGLAVDRLIASILENNYQEDGTVLIPRMLWNYTNGIEKITI